MKKLYKSYLTQVLFLTLLFGSSSLVSAQCLFTATASSGATGCATTALTSGPSGTGTSILYSENFESYSVGIVDGSTSPWRGQWQSGSGWSWWAMANCSPITGSRSMTMYNADYGTLCDYDDAYSLNEISYNINKINATGYTNVRLNFKWKGYAEPNFDYAQVVYSLNGTTWTSLPTKYAGQSTTQTVANLDLTAMNGQQFYLGFRWINDSYAYNTPFMVDDITVTGDKAYTYAWSGPAGTTYSPSSTSQNPTVNKTGTYTVSVTSGTCTSTATVSATVDPQPVAATSISTSATSLCVGGSVTITRNGTTNGQDRWWMSRDGVTWAEFSDEYAGQASFTRTLNTAGTYLVYHHPWGGACGWSGWGLGKYSATITVYEQPSISLTGNNQTVCSGANATAFSASISGGSGCGYQWQSSVDGSTWGNISGAISSTYTPTGLTNSAFYRVVTSSCATGCTQAISQVRFVAVTAVPTVQTHPTPTSQAVCAGNNVAYSSQANIGSGTVRYRLVLLSAHGANWHGIQEIRGYNTAGTEQTLTCLGASSTTYSSDLCGSASYGAGNAFDAAYPVSNSPSSTAQWLTPAQSTAAGSPNTNWQNYATVNPFYNPEWIEWSAPQPLSSIWVYNGRYDVGNTATCFKDYYIMVSYNSGTTWSRVKTGTFNAVPGLDGTNNMIDIEPTYTWKRGATTVGTGKALSLTSVTTGNSGSYTVQMTYGCATATSNTAVLTVGDQPTVNITGASNICYNNGTTLTVATTGGAGTCTYQWQYWTGSSWTNTGTNSATLSTGALTISRVYRCSYTCTGTGCSAPTSSEFKVTVDAAPIAATAPTSTVACPGDNVTLTAGFTPAIDWKDASNWNMSGNITWDAGQQAWRCEGYCNMYLKSTVAPAIDPTKSYNIEVDVYRTVNNGKIFYWGGDRLNSSYSHLNGYGGTYDYSAGSAQSPPVNEWKTYQKIGKTGTTASADGWGSAADATAYYRVGGLINYNGTSTEITYIRNIKFYYDDVHYIIDNPITYQWQKNGTNVSGATNASLTLTGVTAANAGTYTLNATNACGTTSSAPAVVIVNPVPTTPSIAVTSGSTTGCGSVNATFEASSSIAGNALDLNGTSSYSLGNPSALQITGNMTIEMWLRPTSFSQRRNPWGKAYGGEGTITQETNGTLNFYWGTGAGNTTPYTGFNSGTALVLNQWSHIAIVRDMTNNTVNWYINGVLTNSMVPPYSGSVSSLAASIGQNYTGQGYLGQIDELRVWNVARSQVQVQSTMNTVVAAFQASLAGYWRMDETTGNITDASGSNLVSVLSGSPAFISSGAPIWPNFTWSPGTQLNTTVGSTVTSTSTASRTYTVTATSPVGCSTTNANIAVTVNTIPTASVSGTNTICAGGSSTFTASGGGTYLWSTGATSAAISVSTAGTYTVTVTNSGCTATASRALTVNALPSISITPTSPTICNGGSVTLTASGGASYAWSSGSGTSTTSVSPASTTSYTVTVTGGNTCTATASKSVTVTQLVIGGQTFQSGDYVFSGASSTAWGTAANWYVYNGSSFAPATVIPANTNNTFVYPAATHTCIINGTVDFSGTNNTKDVTIKPGATINATTNSRTINVYGNWDNDGTFTKGNSTVAFRGATNTTVSAGASDFNNVNVNKTANGTTVEFLEDFACALQFLLTRGTVQVPQDVVGEALTTRVEVNGTMILKEKTSGTKGGEFRSNP